MVCAALTSLLFSTKLVSAACAVAVLVFAAGDALRSGVGTPYQEQNM
jgi:dolichol kinase